MHAPTSSLWLPVWQCQLAYQWQRCAITTQISWWQQQKKIEAGITHTTETRYQWPATVPLSKAMDPLIRQNSANILEVSVSVFPSNTPSVGSSPFATELLLISWSAGQFEEVASSYMSGESFSWCILLLISCYWSSKTDLGILRPTDHIRPLSHSYPAPVTAIFFTNTNFHIYMFRETHVLFLFLFFNICLAFSCSAFEQ